MPELPLTADFESIVLDQRPLIDVRAPVEFSSGAFPGAVNLPLMDDEDRHLIGIRYKEEGNEAAVKLGHERVSGEIRASRTKAWTDFMHAHPNAMLYCFRGGQRSAIAQSWIDEAQGPIIRLKGGYKAFRNYLLTQLETSVNHFQPIVIGGRTGSGKTILLKKLRNAIDLEGLANHRGSSFGRKITPQPTQINFENALAYELIHKRHEGHAHLIFEDEGKNIGTIYMPKLLATHLSTAPRVILETSLDKRIETTFDEYVIQAQKMYEKAGMNDPLQVWHNDIQDAMQRIQKRIGGERHKMVIQLFNDAYNAQLQSSSMDAYKAWVSYLLCEYYDPMYDYQIQRRADLIRFRGNEEEVLEYLRPFD